MNIAQAVASLACCWPRWAPAPTSATRCGSVPNGTVSLSRSDLVGAATSVAERVGGAHRVAVLATPTAATVLAVTGCLIAGVPVVPVPADVGHGRTPSHPHRLRRAGLARRSSPTSRRACPHIPVRLHARSWHRYPEPSPDATAMIMYTSGTTGPPKGVVLSRRAIAADLDALADAWQWTPDDTLVHGLPLFHVHGLVLGLLGLAAGGQPVRAHRQADARGVRGGRRHAVLRGADGVVAGGRRPRRPPRRCGRRDCWCRAARRCPSRCSTGWPNSPGTSRSSGTAPASR